VSEYGSIGVSVFAIAVEFMVCYVFRMKTWIEISDVLFLIQEQFYSNGLSTLPFAKTEVPSAGLTYETAVKLLFERNLTFQKEADSIARSLARSEPWPEAPGLAYYFAFLRINSAIDFVNQLLTLHAGKQVIAEPQLDEPALLEWLLIDLWNEWRFDSFLKLMALQLANPSRSFYGIEGFDSQSKLSPIKEAELALRPLIRDALRKHLNSEKS